jgi:hypothetical protein
MPRAGPSRSQRQPSQTQTQTQRYGRSRRRHEDEDDAEEIVPENYDDEDEPGMQDTNTVRAALISCNLTRLHFSRT